MRILSNICCDNLQKSKDFYTQLLDLQVKYDSNWYIQLCCPKNQEIEYGIIRKDHSLIPRKYQRSPTGMYMTFIVDNDYKRALR